MLFRSIVKKIWERPVAGDTPIQRWTNKIRALRKYLVGWARHATGMLKKEKQRLSSSIDDLEALAESRPLSMEEIELKSQSNALIASSFGARRSLSGISVPSQNLFSKEIQIRDTFIVWPIADTERNTYIL